MTLVFLKIDMRHQDPIVKGPQGGAGGMLAAPWTGLSALGKMGAWGMGHGAWKGEGELGGGGGGGSEGLLGLEKRVD